LSIFVLLLAPVFVSAQEQPIECCKMRNSVTLTSGKVKIPGNAAGTEFDCSLSANATNCTLAKGETVGDVGAICPQTNRSGAANAAPDRGTNQWGVFCVINTIQTFVDWFFAVLVAVAVLLAIIGAFNILTAGGSPEKVNTGRNYIMFAAIGLAIAFIARAVPSIVKAIMGF